MSFQYSPRIITDGLVLCLDAGNPNSYPGSGNTWTDLSRGRNNGTLINGPTFSGENQGSIVFDGVNNYVDIDLNILNHIDVNEGTIEAFVKTTVGTQTDTILGFWDSINFNVNRGFLGIGNSTGTYSDELFSYYAIASQGSFGIVARDPSVSTEYSLLDGNFHHFVIVIKPNNNAMYLDSIPQNFSYRLGNASNPRFINVPNLDVIRLGMDSYDGGRFFYNGNMFNFKIYNRALTPTEILQNYNATKGRFGL